MQKYLRTGAILGLLITTISLQSCGVLCKNKTPATETEIVAQKPIKMRIHQPLTIIDLRILDSEIVTVIPNDFESIIQWMAKAKYDKKWNETAIMVKMKTPDYSLDLKSETQGSQIVSFWVDGGRLKVDETWYLLKPTDSKNLADFLSKYKNAFDK